MHKIRVVLDTEEDVIRTILVDHTINLETLHSIIASSFGFNGLEMASFYRTDHEWNQGEEIPLFDMSEVGESMSMQHYYIKNTLPNAGEKLIYVYDFLSMWTFYVEAIEVSEESIQSLPKTILSVGDIPKEAPTKEFKAENSNPNLSDEFNDEFESLDNIDFDNY